ncbi:MAG TPA: dihydrofolate reductase family protein [Phototrophicaceae bacterium]|jgi:dihydrofolate reductase|nr:dihydrofolate reductase family protein [Phototrophicaceae bacterium]
MSKLVVTTFLSLDGIMEEPRWSMSYWNDQISDFKLKELFASDSQLLGRVTYEGFAQAWPSQTDEAGFGDRMNNMPKYVVSTTLKQADWNNSHTISDNVVEEIQKLKAQPGGDILVGGSATLIQTLIKHDLVDEYHILLYPVVLGSGKRLFHEGTTATVKLIEARPIGSGVTLLIYEPDRK